MKVAIIGTAPASRAVAPFDDHEWQIWGCSQGNQGQLPRVTKWFELHPIPFFTAPENRAWGLPYLAWLKSQEFPVYVQEPSEHLPQAIVFPIRKIIDVFGRNWLTSSISMMIGYALLQMKEGDSIGLFGVDMAAHQEHYTAQRAGIYRFTEFAHERGVNVITPYESDLGAPVPIYGYSEATRFGRKMVSRIAETEGLINNLIGQRDKISHEIAYAQGALHTSQWVMRSFLNGEDAELDIPTSEEPKRIPIDEMKSVSSAVPLTGDFAPRASGLFWKNGVEQANGDDR